MLIGQALDLVSRYDSLRNPLTSLGDYLDPELISRCLAAKWHLNRSQFGITIDHDLAYFRSLIGIRQSLQELTLFTTVSIAVFKPVETSMSKKRKSRSTMETCFKILQLKFDKKLTNRCIGLTLHISASTVFEVLARFKASSLSWPLPADISHDTLEKLIFPPKDTSASELVMPDMLYFDTEMRKPGVTRQLLWMEYKAQAGDKAMGYSHFCRCYRKWKKTRRLSMRQEHRAGEKLFIDFCGPTVPVINPDNRRDAPRGNLRGCNGGVQLYLC